MQLKTQPPAAVNSSSVQFSWIGTDQTTDNEPLLYSYRVDDGQWTEYSLSDNTTLSSLSDGAHTFEVRAKDEVGNTSKTNLSYRFEVDTTPPRTTVTLTRVDRPNNYTPMIEFSGSDNLSPVEALTYQVNIAGQGWGDVTPGMTGVSLQPGLTPWAPGYRVEVRARDAVGNVDPNPAVLNLQMPYRYFLFKPDVLGVPTFAYLIAGAVLLIILFGIGAGLYKLYQVIISRIQSSSSE